MWGTSLHPCCLLWGGKHASARRHGRIFSTRNGMTERYADVSESGLTPIQHFIRQGAAECRDPNPAFDTDWYLRAYPDVAGAGRGPDRAFRPLWRCGGQAAVPRIRCLPSVRWDRARL